MRTHLPLMPNSNKVKPVVLPPGRARLSTNPAPTGSITVTNTIGTVRVTRCNASTTIAPIGPTQLLERLQERLGTNLPLRIVCGQIHEHSDPHLPIAGVREMLSSFANMPRNWSQGYLM